MNNKQARSRVVYILLIVAVVMLGLASRAKAMKPHLPYVISEYAGDTLWAIAVFLGLGFLFPTFSTWRIAALAALFAVGVELSQLYHAPWIDAIRHTQIGGLILGFSFLWSDLACYAVGILCGIGFKSAADLVKARTSA